MKAHLEYFLFKIKESFWFLPTIMVLASIGLSRIALGIDRVGDMGFITDVFWFGSPDIDSSRLILSTVTGAMITTASLVFSLTLVSLTLASQQLGPRLLSMFLRDRITQAVLGLFLATFIYGLIVLMAIGGVQLGQSVPIFSMTIAILATIASFVALIVFIHHLATSLQADVVIARVALELHTLIERQFDDLDDNHPQAGSAEAKAPASGATLNATASGYIQAVDHSEIFKLACEQNLCIRVLRRPGHFLSRGEPLAIVSPAPKNHADCQSALAKAVVFGSKRTPTQDPEFSLMAIVEIALRALSPGINDPHTANTCVDRLSDALRAIFQRREQRRMLCDEDGAPRVFLDTVTTDGLMDSAFNEIRQFTATNVSVSVRLAEALARLAHAVRTPEHAQAVRRHCDLLTRACKSCIDEDADIKAIESALGTALQTLDKRSTDGAKENDSPDQR